MVRPTLDTIQVEAPSYRDYFPLGYSRNCKFSIEFLAFPSDVSLVFPLFLEPRRRRRRQALFAVVRSYACFSGAGSI